VSRCPKEFKKAFPSALTLKDSLFYDLADKELSIRSGDVQLDTRAVSKSNLHDLSSSVIAGRMVEISRDVRKHLKNVTCSSTFVLGGGIEK
jgi:hypothetical protein